MDQSCACEGLLHICPRDASCSAGRDRMNCHDVCKRCVNDHAEQNPDRWNKWDDVVEDSWREGCSYGKAWGCRESDTYNLENAEPYPPSWCHYKVELLMIVSDDDHHPQRVVP